MGFAWFAFLRQVALRRPLGNRPAPDWLMVLAWFLTGIGLPWLFISARLVVEVREDGLHYRFTLSTRYGIAWPPRKWKGQSPALTAPYWNTGDGA
ncbi:MAG: hypothetical protein ACUVT4_04225 [Actinomycetota bacterium]